MGTYGFQRISVGSFIVWVMLGHCDFSWTQSESQSVAISLRALHAGNYPSSGGASVLKTASV